MKNIKRTFTEILSKFFKPVYAYKKESIMAAFPVVITSFISIYLVYLLKDISNYLEKWFDEKLINLLILFSWLIIFNIATIIITRNRTHAVLWPTYRKYMYKNYVNDFILLDNNETEKLWIWKLVAMIDKWMHAWVDLLIRFFIEILSSIILVIFSLFLIWIININYLLYVLIIFSFILLFTYIIQK